MGKSYNRKMTDTTIRLGEVRFCFVNVFAPRHNDSGEDKYGVCVLVPKEDTQAKKIFDEAREAAIKQGIAGKWNGKRPSGLKLCELRDGDEDRPDDDAFAGHWYFNASAKKAPGVAVLDGGTVTDALDDDDFYSGCYGAVTVNLYPYANQSKGVAAGLNNVIKTRDGEKFSGGTSAAEDFADMA